MQLGDSKMESPLEFFGVPNVVKKELGVLVSVVVVVVTCYGCRDREWHGEEYSTAPHLEWLLISCQQKEGTSV